MQRNEIDLAIMGRPPKEWATRAEPFAAHPHVLVTAGSAEKVRACEELGADHAINYRSEDFVEAVKEATRGHGADVILDTRAPATALAELGVLAERHGIGGRRQRGQAQLDLVLLPDRAAAFGERVHGGSQGARPSGPFRIHQGQRSALPARDPSGSQRDDQAARQSAPTPGRAVHTG